MKNIITVLAISLFIGSSTFAQQQEAAKTYDSKFPFYTYYDYSWYVSTYNKDEVGVNSIGAIELSLKENVTASLKNCEIYLSSSNTINQNVTSTAGMTKVFSGDININGTNKVSVNFNTSFQLEGQYLLVYFVNNSNTTVFPAPEFLNKTDDNATTTYNYSVFGNLTNEVLKTNLKPVVSFKAKSILSIEEHNSLSSINCYPNPVNSTLTIENKANATMKIYNSLGAIVLPGNQNSNMVDLSSLKSGLYFVEFTLGNERVIKQITKE